MCVIHLDAGRQTDPNALSSSSSSFSDAYVREGADGLTLRSAESREYTKPLWTPQRSTTAARGRPWWTRIDTHCVTPCIPVKIKRNFVGTKRELQSRHSSAASRAQVLSRMRDGQAKGDVF